MTLSYAPGVFIDWTDGAGKFATDTITIPADLNRRVFLVQNRDTTDVTVTFVAQKSSDGAACTITETIAPGVASGSQGGGDERSYTGAGVQGQIVVTGTTDAKVLVATIN